MSASVDGICSSFPLCASYPFDNAAEKCVFYHHITAAIRSICTPSYPFLQFLAYSTLDETYPRDERSSCDPMRTRFSSRRASRAPTLFVEFADYFVEKWRKALSLVQRMRLFSSIGKLFFGTIQLNDTYRYLSFSCKKIKQVAILRYSILFA